MTGRTVADGHYPLLDGLRALAVSLVIWHHWLPEIYRANVPIGHYGVVLFFVISGFLITEIVITKGSNSRQFFIAFYARRALRIFPPYFILIFSLLGLGVTTLGEALYHLTYLSNFLFFFEQEWPSNGTGVFWSLATEEQFYIFWPAVVIWLLVRAKSAAYLALFATLLHFAQYALYSYSGFGFFEVLPPFSFAGLFCGGGLCLFLNKKHKDVGRRKISRLSFLFVLFVPGILYVSNHEVAWTLSFMVSISGYLSIVGLVSLCLHSNNGLLIAIFSNQVARFLGKISYGLYLYHMFSRPVLIWLIDALNLNDGLRFGVLGLVLNFIVLISISLLSWVLLERPALSLKKWFRYERRGWVDG